MQEPEETPVVTEVPVPTETPTEVVPDPVVEPETPDDDTHPLDPGGKRFSEVYRDMRDAQRDNQELRSRLARLEAAPAAPAQTKEAWFTPEQLDGFVQTGKITQTQATAQLIWQQSTMQSRQDTERRQAENVQLEAKREIDKYAVAIPALLNRGSVELQKVERVAREISSELGLPIQDLRVQKRALREVYGAPDRLNRANAVRENARVNADVHAEVSPGSGGAPTSKDPLANVPPRYLDHWKKVGYTRQQMIDEAKYIPKHRMNAK